jgi:hypothetical protein
MSGQVKKRLGELLIDAGVIDETQLKAALGHQRQWGIRLGQALVDLKLASEQDVVKVLAKRFGFEVARLDQVEAYAHQQAVALVPREFAQKHNVFPMAADTSSLSVAMSDPTNLAVVDELRFRTGRKVKVSIGGDREIAAAVKAAYPSQDGGVEAIALDIDETSDDGESVMDSFGGGSSDAYDSFFGTDAAHGHPLGQPDAPAPQAPPPAAAPGPGSAPPVAPRAAPAVPANLPRPGTAPAPTAPRPTAAPAAPAAAGQSKPVPPPGRAPTVAAVRAVAAPASAPASAPAPAPAAPARAPAAQAAPPVAPRAVPAGAPPQARAPTRPAVAAVTATQVATQPAPRPVAPPAAHPSPQRPALEPLPSPDALRDARALRGQPAAPSAPAPAPSAPPTPVDAEELSPLPEELVGAAGGSPGPGALTPNDQAVLEALERLASGGHAEPEVLRPTQAIAVLVRMLLEKGVIGQRELLDALRRDRQD